MTIPQNQPAMPQLSGTAKNTSETRANANAVGKVFDSEGRVLATGIDTIAGIDPGETWRFEIAINSMNPQLQERISDHTVVLAVLFAVR
jgi:hypothetical protein